MRAGWTASGACTSGSTAPPGDATRRASGGAATTSTRRAEGLRREPSRRRAFRAASRSVHRCLDVRYELVEDRRPAVVEAHLLVRLTRLLVAVGSVKRRVGQQVVRPF